MAEGSGTTHVCLACDYKTRIWDADAEYHCPKCDDEVLLPPAHAEAVRRDRRNRAGESVASLLLTGDETDGSAVVALRKDDQVLTFRGHAETYSFENAAPTSATALNSYDAFSLDMAVTDREITDAD